MTQRNEHGDQQRESDQRCFLKLRRILTGGQRKSKHRNCKQSNKGRQPIHENRNRSGGKVTGCAADQVDLRGFSAGLA